MSKGGSTRVSARVAKPKAIHINVGRCKGCELCIEICPLKRAEILKMSEELSRRGYRYPVVHNLNACTGCRLCQIVCPEFAIFLEFEEGVGQSFTSRP